MSCNLVIIYVGHNRCLDYDWLKRATKRRETIWLFVCPKSKELEELAVRPNVVLLGLLPHEKIAALLRTAHYGVIPFVKDELTRYVFPVKYLEYLAADLDVIMTDFYDGELPDKSQLPDYDWKIIVGEILKRL